MPQNNLDPKLQLSRTPFASCSTRQGHALRHYLVQAGPSNLFAHSSENY